MSEQVQTKHDLRLRDYQQNILAVCLKRNSIIYLPTGSGKTFIAIQVIKYFSDQLTKKYSEGGKRTFFLVNTVALAKQQAEHIKPFLPFNVRILTGEDDVDNFNQQKWLQYLDDNEIFVMTAQCFADALSHTFISRDSISVLIFDECHHGRKGHVYHQIMQNFESCDSIRIIGLTGNLIGIDNKTKPYTVAEELKKLESTYQSAIITVNDIDDQKNVLVYSTKAREFVSTFGRSPIQKCLSTVIANLSCLQNYLSPIKFSNCRSLNPRTLREMIPMKIKELIDMLKDLEYQAENMGNYGSFLGLMNILIQLELTKRVADTEKFREIVKTCITKVEFCINYMKRNLGLDKKNRYVVMENSSEKIQKLFLILEKFYKSPDIQKDLQCLIFTERRSSAKILYHMIKCFGNEEKNFPIKPDFVVGRNNTMPESIESVLSHSNNNLALDKFNNKETNLIVCTNVLEEGIDLQACNLVIVYDPPKTLRSYVQSRGRARDDFSYYIVMLENSDVSKFNNKFAIWRAVNFEMKNQLIGKTIDRCLPDEESIRDEQKQEWDPFYTNENASLTALNCIPILNQYAQTVPTDRFTNARIDWNRHDQNGLVQVSLRLPTQAMLSDIIVGDWRSNLKIAKQDVCFKTCIKLYKNGLLTEQLTPVDSKLKVENYNDIYFHHWDKYKNDDPKKAGTKNNRRSYKIKVPDALQNSGPIVGTNFLYRINMKPKFDTENSNALKVFHHLLQNANTFGFLSRKRFPKLCKMNLFQSYGEIECEISDLPTAVNFETNTELQMLRRFHVNIFRDILKIFENFFVLDQSSYLIVPINDFNEIQWTLIEKFAQIPKPVQMSKSEILNIKFEPEDYIYKVVNPVYREHTDQNYVVIDVIEHKNPFSQFPNKNAFQTYEDYFKDKYNVTIYRQDQFLIEVKGITKNLNLFFPGSGAQGRKKKYERFNECEEYIPEICHNYKFPGDFWLKATFLPSICHRIFYMLLAEELRRWLIIEEIDRDCGMQKYELDVDYGNYEKRSEKAKSSDYNCLEKLESFQKILTELQNKEAAEQNSKSNNIRTLADLQFGQSVPIDIDRNWLNITDVDIEYYCTFVSGATNVLNNDPKSLSPLHLVSQKYAEIRSIKGEEIVKDIKLLSFNNLSQSIQQKDLIKVLTTSNAGDVFDMERYEALGDSCLKFLASLYLYKTYEGWHEGYLTAMKGKIVSNRNLYYIGNNFGLSSMLKTTQFTTDYSFAPSTKLPSNITEILENNRGLLRCLLDANIPLSNDEIENGYIDENSRLLIDLQKQMNEGCEDEECVDKTLICYLNEQYIGDKVIADAVEALLGCTVSSIGLESAVKLCQILKILPKQNVDSLLTEEIKPRIVFETEVKLMNQLLLEQKINYKFKNNIFLTQALTHSSYPNKSSGTYQQLEFLGDAVLDFLITAYIYERCPNMSPGQLTDLRSALVNNVTLGCIVVRYEIYKHMLYENQSLAEAIKKFTIFQISQNHEITDQVVLMKTEDDTNIAKSVEVPKALGDIFESIIGAVYLDSNLSLPKTWDVIYHLMHNEIHKFMEDIPVQIIRRLHEFHGGQAEPKFFESETIEGDENIAVPLRIKNRHGKEEFIIGFGKNRQLAKQAAAKKALIELMKQN